MSDNESIGDKEMGGDKEIRLRPLRFRGNSLFYGPLFSAEGSEEQIEE
jgi:hypothetical protein